MGGYYPDGVNQTIFDLYHRELDGDGIEPDDCACGSARGKDAWACSWSDDPEDADALPCICLCHVEQLLAEEQRENP